MLSHLYIINLFFHMLSHLSDILKPVFFFHMLSHLSDIKNLGFFYAIPPFWYYKTCFFHTLSHLSDIIKSVFLYAILPFWCYKNLGEALLFVLQTPAVRWVAYAAGTSMIDNWVDGSRKTSCIKKILIGAHRKWWVPSEHNLLSYRWLSAKKK